MFLTIIIILAVAEIVERFFGKRYEMSEKVDRGTEICYWKLSYRRKFIRTLWLIPVYAVVIAGFCRENGVNIFTGIIGIVLFCGMVIQAVYNYIKWKQEINE